MKSPSPQPLAHAAGEGLFGLVVFAEIVVKNGRLPLTGIEWARGVHAVVPPELLMKTSVLPLARVQWERGLGGEGTHHTANS